MSDKCVNVVGPTGRHPLFVVICFPLSYDIVSQWTSFEALVSDTHRISAFHRGETGMHYFEPLQFDGLERLSLKGQSATTWTIFQWFNYIFVTNLFYTVVEWLLNTHQRGNCTNRFVSTDEVIISITRQITRTSAGGEEFCSVVLLLSLNDKDFKKNSTWLGFDTKLPIFDYHFA